MSLFRQLWLAVIVGMLVTFSGSLLVSMLTARHYLEQQLAMKNADNASSLALSLSQQAKDPVTVELLVAALYDSGQYAEVRLLDPDGKVMVERMSPADAGDVPQWFVRVFPIESRPGQAQVSDGWRQFATIHLVSHSRFAYKELWNGGLSLLAWFACGGLVLGLLGMQLLARIRRPLDAVVRQATAISERRFVSIEAPRIPELNSLAQAMNAMVERLKAMFAEEAARLEQVRREANLDNLTGLSNRAYFMNQLQLALDSDEAPPEGTLLILRLADLAGINRKAGREAADDVLRRTGEAVRTLAAVFPGAVPARLNGADFALLLPGVLESDRLAEPMLAALGDLAAAGLASMERIGHVGIGHYRHGDASGPLLASIDAALASAESQGGLAWAKADSREENLAVCSADWQQLIKTALTQQRLKLVDFPVDGLDGRLLHRECLLRLQVEADGEWLPAGRFMPMAVRLSLTTEMDLAAVRLAFQRLEAGTDSVGVNLSGESLRDESFRQRLQFLIESHQALADRLWLEIPEIGVFQHFADFVAFSAAIRPLGCRVGIEHFGRQFSEIGRLHDLGLHFLKVDGSFIRGIEEHPGNQAFLKGLCGIAHSIGLQVIAESVQTGAELATLPELGFDGATGPAVSRG